MIDRNVDVLHAGGVAGQPLRLVAELLRGDHLERIRSAYEVTVADLPPVLSPCATPRLAADFAPLMLVVRAGATPVGRIEDALADLPSAPTVVLNGVESRVPRWLRRLSG